MSGIGFYAIGAAWLFSLIVPLVVLYFLKLKRPRVIMPSLVFWHRVIEDSRVNSPFQKFKRNLLLLLQLLLLILLILAAMQPYWRTGADETDRLLILIDCSASMGAVDEKNSQTRLDVAKEQVDRMIQALNPDQELCLIVCSRSARQLGPFTDNKRILSESLEKVTVHDIAGDITDALRMAAAIAHVTPFDRVLLLSDGNFPMDIDFDLPFQLDFQKLPEAGPNVGITALNARRATGGWSLFVKLQCTKGAQGVVTVELIQDGEPRASESVMVQQGTEPRLVFSIDAQITTNIELRLTTAAFDSLVADNVAFIELSPARPLRVYVSPTLASYRHALDGISDIIVMSGEDNGDIGSDSSPVYDLIITDKPDQPIAQWSTGFHVGYIPDDLKNLLDVTDQGTTVIDWRRTSPLLEHVQLIDLVILEQVSMRDDVNERDLENLYYEVLIHGRQGPLLLHKRDGLKQSFYLLFHSDRSTLAYRVGFPIMLMNLVRTTMHEAGLLEVRGTRAGILPSILLSPVTTYEVKYPDNSTRQETTGQDGILFGIPAPIIGQYAIQSNGKLVAMPGVSLLEPTESLLVSSDQINFEELSVAGTQASVKINKSIWSLLAKIALCVMLLEWWFFQRRPKGVH